MAVLNENYGYLFLAEPETGSRACAAALMQHDGSKNVGSHHHSQWQLLNKGVIDRATLDCVVVFSVIRNPLDILVTRTLKGSKHSLSHHIAKYTFRKLFFRHHGCDRLLRYERGLEIELCVFLHSIGAPRAKLDLIGKSPNKMYWSDYYTEADLEIAKLLIPEIEAYGYA